MRDDNKGQIGTKSIRINGKSLDNLPPHQSRQAQLQLPEAEETELQQTVANILGKYPRTTQEYLEARLKECQVSKRDFKRVRKERQEEIQNLVGLASSQEGPSFRDIEPELEAIGQRDDLTFEEKKALIKEKRLQCSEYDPAALYQQVKQFQEDIDRLDAAIENENDSIADLRSTLGKIEVRDAELKALGVTDIQ